MNALKVILLALAVLLVCTIPSWPVWVLALAVVATWLALGVVVGVGLNVRDMRRNTRPRG